MKKYLFLIFFFGFNFSFAQTPKEIYFHGYSLTEYQQPVLVSGNKYEPQFKNMGEMQLQGRIIIDEVAKKFTVKWMNGDDWICNYTNKEVTTKYDSFLGMVTKTIYTGKWNNEETNDCQLVFTKTVSSGCITTVTSRKVVDSKYGIDCWKKKFLFATSGKCIEN